MAIRALKAFAAAAAVAVALLIAGCETAAINKNTQTTFISERDVIEMTDKFARSFAADGRVAALTAGGPITIVLSPVRAELDSEVMRPETKWLFVNRVALLLSRHPELSKRFRFVMNRADYERIVTREGLRTEMAVPEGTGQLRPDYVLTGTFTSLTNVARRSQDAYYLCMFRLTRISEADRTAGEIIWSEGYETRKAIVSGFLD